METTQKKAASFKGIRSAGWVIVICFIIAVLIFHFVLGNPSNFMNNYLWVAAKVCTMEKPTSSRL
jgi:biopolymer transport protein ExbB